MEPTRRLTMQDVARAAGVHQTTVSLALRNDPRLPEATRRRLQAVAREMGYTPDPMLSALNFYRSTKRGVRAPTTMAFLLSFRDRRELAASYPHCQFVEGAQEHAAQIGYRLEVFYIGSQTPAASERLERTLKARGIAGVIVGAFVDRMTEFQMNWNDFSAVLIESQQLGLSLHMISNHQTMVTRAAVRRLRALGYRRIGLVVGEREESYLRNAFCAGYYVEVAQFADLARIPPCLLSAASASQTNGDIINWARVHDVEAVISNWQHVPGVLRRGRGARATGDVVVASLDLSPGGGSNAGMRQNHRVVGARAVEQLAILMKTNQRGLVSSPNHTLIEGVWMDGSDVPPRQESARRGARKRGSSVAVHQ